MAAAVPTSLGYITKNGRVTDQWSEGEWHTDHGAGGSKDSGCEGGLQEACPIHGMLSQRGVMLECALKTVTGGALGLPALGACIQL